MRGHPIFQHTTLTLLNYYYYCGQHFRLYHLSCLCLFASILFLSACSDEHLPESSIEVASKALYSGSLSPDGEWAFAGSVFQGGSLWRIKDGERLYNWNHTADEEKSIILFADIASSNTKVMTADESTLVLWDINTGEASRFWTSPAKILDIALLGNGQYAALGLADQSAVIFDAVRGGVSRTFRHTGQVNSVAVSDGKSLLITGSEDRTASIWRLNSGEKLFTIRHEEAIDFVTLSQDGNYALTASQYDKAEIWDVSTQQSLGAIPMKKQHINRGLRVTAAAFSNDSALLLIAYPNRVIELRDVSTLAIIDQWMLPKRNQWQPTSAVVLDLAFDRQQGVFHAISSDGFLHRLEQSTPPE
jgi:WD40 repeat protein